MSQDMIGTLPLHVVRGPRDTLEDQLAGPEGRVVLDELKRFIKSQSCWTTPRPESDGEGNSKRAIGMLGLVPLGLTQGPRNELDKLLAGSKGEIVRLELLKFVEHRPCWVERDEDVVVRNGHGHVVIKVKGLRLRGDEEVDRLTAAGYEVSEQAVKFFCTDEETGSYGADQILKQDHEYTVALVGQRSEAEKAGYHKPLAGLIPRLCEAVSDKVLRHLGVKHILAPHEPVCVDHKSYTEVVFEFYVGKEGQRVVDVHDCHRGIYGRGTSTMFMYLIGTPPKQRQYVEQVKLNNRDAEKALHGDAIIRVDRKKHPSYPHWVVQALHLELEKIGAEEYDLEKIERWFHPEQKKKKGSEDLRFETIYEHLKSNNMIEPCLGLRDGEEIMKRGHLFFKKVFGDVYKGQHCNIPLWKSVAEFRRRLPEGGILDRGGDPGNPADQYHVYRRFAFISASFDDIHLCWWPLSNTLGNYCKWPTLLLPR